MFFGGEGCWKKSFFSTTTTCIKLHIYTIHIWQVFSFWYFRQRVGNFRLQGCSMPYKLSFRAPGTPSSKHALCSDFDGSDRYVELLNPFKASQKKVTFRMLLEPWCSRSITTSQPDLDKPVSGDLFTHFSYHNLTESSTPELCPWGNLAPLLSILVRIIGLHQHDESHLFLIFFYILVDLVKQILNTDCLGSWWTALSQHFVRLAPTGSITSRGLKGERYFRLSRFS